MTDGGSMCCGGNACIGLCGGNLVGRHNGHVMTVDDLGHHAKRWKTVEPWIHDASTKWKPGDLGFDLLNEIDRLRFLLAEPQRSEPVKPGMVADDCSWCRDHGYRPGQQLTHEGVPEGEPR